MTSIDVTNREKTFLNTLEAYWPLLVWLLFGFTVLTRLVNLSNIPISESESNLAVFASKLALNQVNTASELPVYTGLTAVLFFVFGNADFWTRILPIVAGSSLIFLPFLWKDRLGFGKALALSLVFALLPTTAYFSRSIASPVFSTAALLWLVSLLRLKRWVAAGFAAACLWLSGSFALPLSLVAGLGLLIARTGSSDTASILHDLGVDIKDLRRFGSAVLISLVLISTSFLIHPAGLGDIGSFFTTAPDLFSNWQLSELVRSAFLLVKYNLIALIIFAWSWISLGSRAEESKPGQAVWLITAGLFLVASIINAGFLLPFNILVWVLTIRDLETIKWSDEQKRSVYFPLIVFGIALLIYVSLVAKSWASASYNAAALGLAAAAGLILFALAHGFVGLGWSPTIAKRAALISIGFVMFTGMLSVTFKYVLAEPEKSALHWQDTPTYSVDPLRKLLEEFRQSDNFKPGELVFKSDGVPGVPYLWLSRNFTSMSEEQPIETIQVFITASDEPGSLIEANYRGMSYVGAEIIDWSTLSFQQLVAGIFDADLPINRFQHYLWVEKSFFSGN